MATATFTTRTIDTGRTYASAQLRWALLLDDHPETPPPIYEVAPDPAPAGFAREQPGCQVTVAVPGRPPVHGYRSLAGIRQGETDGWHRRCLEALSDALEAAGYPATIEDLKLLSRWRRAKREPVAPAPPDPLEPPEMAPPEPRPESAEPVDPMAELETVVASLGSRRPALEAWCKDQGRWPVGPDDIEAVMTRAAELAAEETFTGPLTDPEADPVESARDFLDRMGVAVPEPEPLDAEISAVRDALADLDARMADADDDLIRRLAAFLEDEGLPLFLEAMTPDQLDVVSTWLTDQGLP